MGSGWAIFGFDGNAYGCVRSSIPNQNFGFIPASDVAFTILNRSSPSWVKNANPRSGFSNLGQVTTATLTETVMRIIKAMSLRHRAFSIHQKFHSGWRRSKNIATNSETMIGGLFGNRNRSIAAAKLAMLSHRSMGFFLPGVGGFGFRGIDTLEPITCATSLATLVRKTLRWCAFTEGSALAIHDCEYGDHASDSEQNDSAWCGKTNEPILLSL